MQKEQRAKEQRHEEKAADKESIEDMLESVPPPETSSPLGTSDSEGHYADVSLNHVPSSFEPFPIFEEDVDYEVQTSSGNGYADFGTGQNVERRVVQGSGHWNMILAQRQVPPKLQGLPIGFHSSQNSQASKLGGMRKHGISRDIRAAPTVNGNKVWSQKRKPENDCGIVKTRVTKEAVDQPEQSKNHEVLIGSISVTLGNCNQHESKGTVNTLDDCMVDHQVPKKNNVVDKPKPDSIQCGANRPTVKFWRPVSHHGIKGPVPVQNGIRESEADVNAGQAGDHTLSNESCLRSMDDNNCRLENNSSLMEDSIHAGSVQFNSHAAKAFLSERWKEAIAAERVKLVLTRDSESSGYQEIQSECEVEVFQSSDLHKRRF